jgi:mono/diheme cytochrome c family protein
MMIGRTMNHLCRRNTVELMCLKKSFPLLLLLMMSWVTLSAEPTVAAGKELFTANCAACHAKNMKDKLTGPALEGTEDRWAAYPRADLYAWIRNSQALIKTGHPRATELWNQYKPTLMNNFTALTDEQIESLLLYIKNPAPTPTTTGPTTPADEPKTSGINWYFVALAAGLSLLAFALMLIVGNLDRYASAREGKLVRATTFMEKISTKGFIAFSVFCILLFGGYKTVDNATNMGRQQNYQPTQPINFSHKIHAGVNKIDCQYCHDTARKSKQSGIPAANTCMNCHAAIKKGTISGTTEITKIFASIGFDPIAGKYIPDYENWSDEQIETLYKKWIGQEYMSANSISAPNEATRAAQENQWKGVVKALKNDTNGRIQGPIEWVRIHNLADHVYFNHAQHVTVGKIECQKCHGKIETMDEVYQYSTLGMGWCISCHRETEVKFKDNDYYKQYARYHEELANGKRDKVTVEEIGGLECQKCHY